MPAESWERLKSAVTAALACPPELRRLALHESLAAHPESHTEAERLISFAEKSPGFLETPAADPFIGSRLGSYRVIRELGRGGMGSVYMATRDDGAYEARVAIKVLDTGAPHSSEIQALARLDHPNIARILDAGNTASSRTYFVMEYVDGEIVTGYCRDRSIGVDDSVRLFLQIARAVAHAHTRGVIHRDIKPSNVLVTGAGEAKLLDFGVAKILENAAANTTHPAISLLHASPEQLRGEPVRVPSDIYALGVLLYEMLTGTVPYELSTGSVEELTAAILDREPRRLSAHRRAAAGDLEAIVHTALRKTPGERYDSVESLIGDLEAALAGIPIRRRGGGIVSLAGRFLRRSGRRLAIGAAVAGAAFTAAGLFERHERAAEERLQALRGVVRNVVSQIDTRLTESGAPLPVRRAAMLEMIAQLEDARRHAADDPALLTQLAEGYARMIPMKPEFDVADRAAAGKAVEVRERLAVLFPSDAVRQRELAGSLLTLAAIEGYESKEKAKLLYQRAATILRTVENHFPGPDSSQLLSSALFALANVSVGAGGVASNPETFREPAIHLERALQARPRDHGLRYEYARQWGSLAQDQMRRGEREESRKSLTKALIARDALLEAGETANAESLAYLVRLSGDPATAIHWQRRYAERMDAVARKQSGDPSDLSRAGMAYKDLAWMEKDSDPAAALRSFSIARARLGALLRARPESPMLQEYIEAEDFTGDLLTKQRNFAQARRHYDTALRLREQRLASRPESATRMLDVSFTLLRLASLAVKSGKPAAALPLLERALRLRAEVVRQEPDKARNKIHLAAANAQTGDVLVRLGRRRDAVCYYRRAVDLRLPLEKPVPTGTLADLQSRAAALASEFPGIERTCAAQPASLGGC